MAEIELRQVLDEVLQGEAVLIGKPDKVDPHASVVRGADCARCLECEPFGAQREQHARLHGERTVGDDVTAATADVFELPVDDQLPAGFGADVHIAGSGMAEKSFVLLRSRNIAFFGEQFSDDGGRALVVGLVFLGAEIGRPGEFRFDAFDADLSTLRGAGRADPGDLEASTMCAALHPDDVADAQFRVRLQARSASGHVERASSLRVGYSGTRGSLQADGNCEVRPFFATLAHGR